jgi:hypothetical protein
MNKRLYCACAVMALAAAPCFAAGQSWDGTWKLNEAKSKLTGETMVLEDKGNGMIHVSGGSVTFDYACDGKAYPTLADRTLTCTGTQAAGWEHVTKVGDKVLTQSHWALSADGKTITIKGKEARPDGSTADYTEVWKRESGTGGVVGTWKSVKADEGSDSMTIETKGDWIKIYDPAYKSTVEGKMDGSNLALKGPTAPAGLWQTFKPDGPNKLHYTVKLNDKVLSEGVQTLSADGKTLTDENWAPGKMNEKSVQVYERQ